MNPPPLPIAVPVLPESAPFTPEQRAYLNGFLAGLFSYAPVNGTAANSGAGTGTGAGATLQPLTVVFGSQTGTAEKLARRIAKESGRHGFAATLHDLASYPLTALPDEQHFLVITSTYGDGEPPDNARGFWEALQSGKTPPLGGMRFSVCGLGDRNYSKFCGFAKDLDLRLEALGAHRVMPRAECDVEYEATFAQWLSQALSALGPATAATRTGASIQPIAPSAPVSAVSATPTGHDRDHPFLSRLVANRRLNGPDSHKDVRHLEFTLEGSGLRYEVGDALGVMPRNNPALVAELLARLRATGDETVSGPGGKPLPLREALTTAFEITRIPAALLSWMAQRTGDALLLRVAAPDANGELTQFLHGREIIDLLHAHPEVAISPVDFVSRLRKLQPRLYSISSSPKAHPGQVHLTVGTVRYESLGRPRQGVCSTYLADRLDSATPVGVFVHHNAAFRLPAPEVPLIMVGPGTGIAPFRAFLEERRATGATGRNWLFFGDQRSHADFLYRDEITRFHHDGLLQRLDLAWSRDQEQKVYVQDRLRAAAGELWHWLESGAAFHVCGDASRMAKDVESTLLDIIQTAGGRSFDDAKAYLQSMKSARRYQRDVY